jgi:hypothetical protein
MHADQDDIPRSNRADATAGRDPVPLHRRWPTWGLIALLMVVAGVSFHRAAVPKADFKYFYTDARYVWTQRALNPELAGADDQDERQLPFYLPVVPLLLAPLAAGGPKLAAVLWTIGQVIALGYTLRVLRAWANSAEAVDPRLLTLGACLIALPAIIETAHFNQLSFIVLAMVLAGIAALERGRPVQAGLWLALATVLKLQPAVFALWLALKRQWTALATLASGAVVIALLPCLLAFGARSTGEYHHQWWSYNAEAMAARGRGDARLRPHFLDYHNQSLAAVLLRTTWPDHPYRTPLQPVRLSPRAARGIALLVSLGLAAALVWHTRRPWQRPPSDHATRLRPGRLRAEAAVYLVAMLVFAPLLRTYYLVCAAPGLMLLAQYAVEPRERPRQWPARIALTIWLVGMLAWTSDTARAYGVHLVMLIALAAILLPLGNRVNYATE